MTCFTRFNTFLCSKGINFLLTATVMVMISCVGKVKNTKEKTASSVQEAEKILELTLAKEFYPISDTKIVGRLEPPPPPYKLSEITYLISKTGDQVPTAFSGAALETLSKDYTGSYQVIMRDLEPNTCYQFNVNIETENGVKSDSKVFFSGCTLVDDVSDFYGISQVENVSGLSGAYALKVYVNAATNTTDVLPQPGDTYAYEIYAGKKSKISPNQLFDTTNPEVTKYTISYKYNQTVINGLEPDTEYWVGARALNKGFQANQDNPYYIPEQNEFYLEGKTQSDSVSNISWDSSSFEVNLEPGSAGLTSVTGSWNSVIGLFYNLRFYYVDQDLMPNQADLFTYIMNGNDEACTGSEDGNSDITCKNLSSSATSTTAAGLTSYKNYWMALAICLNEACTDQNKKIVSPIKSIRTEPEVGFYSGVISVLESIDSDHLDRIRLSVTPFDENGGAGDGVACKMRINAGSEIWLNHPDPSAGPPNTINTSDISVLPFNYKSDYFITLSGYNLATTDTYYFKCLPYLVNGSTIEIKSDGILPWVAATGLSLEGPTYTQFPGLDVGFLTCVDSNNSISITWPTPTGGIYAKYLVLLKDRAVGNPIFSVQDAYDEDPGYYVFEEHKDNNSTTIYGLSAGTYDVAVATFLDYMSGTAYIRSSDNVDVGSCTVNP
ncbi:hypothetical protein N9N67_05015 [Bacteriovoracaceae bacterium]|nr:hypothetical protein [Bacteriovoracaceae bacterium]